MELSTKTTMSLSDHIKTADDLAIARAHLCRAFNRLQKYHTWSSKLMKMFTKFLPGNNLAKPWSEVLNILDEEFYYIAEEEKQFEDLGFIYYDLDARYKVLVETGLISTKFSDQDDGMDKP